MLIVVPQNPTILECDNILFSLLNVYLVTTWLNLFFLHTVPPLNREHLVQFRFPAQFPVAQFHAFCRQYS